MCNTLCAELEHIETSSDPFFCLQKDWDDFLKGLDKSLASDIATASHVLDKGEFGPMDMTVRDVRSGEERPVSYYTDANSSIILILLRHFA